MAELVDAADSKSAVRKDVQVRFLFRALINHYKLLIYNGLYLKSCHFLPLFYTYSRKIWHIFGTQFGAQIYMNINTTQRLSRNSQKVYYTLEWGKAVGQRIATGVFSYVKPKDQIQRNHNKEALIILETKRSQMILDRQSISTGYIPQHKLKTNFLDYYAEFVRLNPTKGNRHLPSSFIAFEKFISKGFISPVEVTENLCERFRNYLLSNFNGETPANYFMRFKRVLKAAKKEGYFINDPAGDIAAKSNKNKIIKEILREDDYLILMNTPCTNYEVKKRLYFRWTLA